MDVTPALIVTDKERCIASLLLFFKEFKEVVVVDTRATNATISIVTTLNQPS